MVPYTPSLISTEFAYFLPVAEEGATPVNFPNGPSLEKEKLCNCERLTPHHKRCIKEGPIPTATRARTRDPPPPGRGREIDSA
eukprot:1159967-Pelagomonas_calceolata.AAC.2